MREELIQTQKEEETAEGLLHIASDLDLPLNALTHVFGIVAQRGAGKTYAASVMMEEYVKNGLFVGYIDPLGVMYGIRSSANGEESGLPVLILGGRHGDLPLDYTAGKVITQFILKNRQPFILDLSLFEDQDQQCQFVADLLEGFRPYEEVLLHLFVDEVDLFAPQMPETAQERRSLKAMNALTRRYRAKGFGATLISQRPAVMNKNVLSMIDVLIALRVISPQDIKALDEWIKRNASEQERGEFLSTISSLPTGTGWLWSPQWLRLFRKVTFRLRETFDSSATPQVGVTSQVPKQLAEIDLTEIGSQLTELIERVQNTDPAVLQARINELQEQLRQERRKPQENTRGEETIFLEGGTQLRLTIQVLEAEAIALKNENKTLQKRLEEKEQQIASFVEVTSSEQQELVSRLQATNVNIERAEIHHFYSGVGVQEQPHQPQETSSPLVVTTVELVEEQRLLLASQRDTLVTIKKRMKRLLPFEKRILHILLDHEERAFTRSQLASTMGLSYDAFRSGVHRENNVRNLITLPFILFTQGRSYTYKAQFTQFFSAYDLALVRRELELDSLLGGQSQMETKKNRSEE